MSKNLILFRLLKYINSKSVKNLISLFIGSTWVSESNVFVVLIFQFVFLFFCFIQAVSKQCWKFPDGWLLLIKIRHDSVATRGRTFLKFYDPRNNFGTGKYYKRKTKNRKNIKSSNVSKTYKKIVEWFYRHLLQM